MAGLQLDWGLQEHPGTFSARQSLRPGRPTHVFVVAVRVDGSAQAFLNFFLAALSLPREQKARSLFDSAG